MDAIPLVASHHPGEVFAGLAKGGAPSTVRAAIPNHKDTVLRQGRTHPLNHLILSLRRQVVEHVETADHIRLWKLSGLEVLYLQVHFRFPLQHPAGEIKPCGIVVDSVEPHAGCVCARKGQQVPLSTAKIQQGVRAFQMGENSPVHGVPLHLPPRHALREAGDSPVSTGRLVQALHAAFSRRSASAASN